MLLELSLTIAVVTFVVVFLVLVFAIKIRPWSALVLSLLIACLLLHAIFPCTQVLKQGLSMGLFYYVVFTITTLGVIILYTLTSALGDSPLFE